MSQNRSQRSLYAAAAASCACYNLRRASRVITQLFDQALEPSGLRSTQFAILLEVAIAETTTVPQLARLMAVDRSTMQRNLQPLLKRGLIGVGSDEVRRSRTVTLTARGRTAVEATVPLWQEAQSSFVLQLGSQRWETLREDLSAAVAAARSEDITPRRPRSPARRRRRSGG